MNWPTKKKEKNREGTIKLKIYIAGIPKKKKRNLETAIFDITWLFVNIIFITRTLILE